MRELEKRLHEFSTIVRNNIKKIKKTRNFLVFFVLSKEMFNLFVCLFDVNKLNQKNKQTQLKTLQKNTTTEQNISNTKKEDNTGRERERDLGLRRKKSGQKAIVTKRK